MRNLDEQFSIQLERPVRRGFLDDVRTIKAGISPRQAALDIRRLGTSTSLDRIMTPDAFSETFMAMIDAYHKAGKRSIKQAPWATTFSVQDPEIIALIQRSVAESLSRVAQSSRTSLSTVIQARIAQGWTVASIVKELLGQKVGGQYRGGLIGLSDASIKSSDLARLQLQDLSKAYFDRKLRDPKFDRLIEDAIKSGRQLTPKQMADIVAAYQARLLQARAKMIALMEVNTAINATKLRTFVKAATAAGVSLDQLEKTWNNVGDDRVRHTHQVLGGQTVTLLERFVSPSGVMMEYPGDPTAPLEERAGCRCGMRIRWIKKRF